MKNDPEKVKRLIDRGIIPESTLRMFVADYYTSISVDRTKYPARPYHLSKEKFMNPELQLSGPTELNLADMEKYSHVSKSFRGVYEELAAKNLLGKCLNLADLMAISEKGVKFFQRVFSNFYVPAWASAIISENHLIIPSIYAFSGYREVELLWKSTSLEHSGDIDRMTTYLRPKA